MYIFAKTKKGVEYMYNSSTAVLCKNEQQAQQVAEFLNSNNGTNQGIFKLKENEFFKVYQIDKYDKTPIYKLKSTKNKISVIYNI